MPLQRVPELAFSKSTVFNNTRKWSLECVRTVHSKGDDGREMGFPGNTEHTLKGADPQGDLKPDIYLQNEALFQTHTESSLADNG